MKGLLYKEYCSGKKLFFSFLALSVLFCILGILVFLSMKFGNLQFIPKKEPDNIKLYANIFFYLSYILLMFSLVGCNQSVFSDYSSGWMKFSYTLPLKAWKAVGARYLMGGIIMVFSSLFGLLNVVIISGVSGVAVTFDVIKNMILILVVTVFIFCIEIPLSLKLKNAKAVSTIDGIVFAAIYIGAFITLMLLTENTDEDGEERLFKLLLDTYNKVRDIIAIFAPLIIAAVAGVSMCISVKICQRREQAC